MFPSLGSEHRKQRRHNTKGDVKEFLITDQQFEDFCKRHCHLKCFVPESNRFMKASYLILDERMRFLNKGSAEYSETASILDTDVETALRATDWEPEIFLQRGGIYEWGKGGQSAASNTGCGSPPQVLQW